MSDILCQLSFQTDLLFFLCDVVYGYFKTEILKDDAFHIKDTPVFIYCDSLTLFTFSGRTLTAVAYKIGYIL